jgi:glycosyltransferase involved in cell wall biosynthesis
MPNPSPSGRPRLLFVYQEPTSFVGDDLALLGERYDVRPFAFGQHRLVAAFAKQARWLHRELPRADLLFGWFADYHLALPMRWARRLGKPAVVALGGYDCVRLPSLGYGVFASRWRAPLARRVAREATALVPVAEALVASVNGFAAWPARLPQGIRTHVPGLETPCEVVPTGYDPAAWPPGPEERGATVCTVAFVDRERTFRLKGLDLLIEAARGLPDVGVEVVGVAPAFAEWIREHARPPQNVRLLPPCAREALPAVYARASVYAQLSRSEGLPNALCEAMLCGCVPVVSEVGGMPEAVGDVGLCVEAPDPGAIAEALVRALAAAPARRPEVRVRVAALYSRTRRREALSALFDRLLAAR